LDVSNRLLNNSGGIPGNPGAGRGRPAIQDLPKPLVAAFARHAGELSFPDTSGYQLMIFLVQSM
jgi:hypothetical protein